METKKRANIPLGLLILALIGLAWVYCVNALMSPWIYTVGGGVRPVPFWQGRADVAGPGGSYRLFVILWPSASKVAGTHVRGSGWVCAPSGKAYFVRVGGGTSRSVWGSMDRQSFHLYTRGPHDFDSMMSGSSAPPKLDFRGRWEGDTLAMTDDGTLAAAFTADGALRTGASHNSGAVKPAVFREAAWGFWGMGKPC